MASYWEIRESHGDRERRTEIDEAFDCGYEEGYEAAMAEMREHEELGERRGSMGYRYGRDKSREHELGERRGRDRMGRYR